MDVAVDMFGLNVVFQGGQMLHSLKFMATYQVSSGGSWVTAEKVRVSDLLPKSQQRRSSLVFGLKLNHWTWTANVTNHMIHQLNSRHATLQAEFSQLSFGIDHGNCASLVAASKLANTLVLWQSMCSNFNCPCPFSPGIQERLLLLRKLLLQLLSRGRPRWRTLFCGFSWLSWLQEASSYTLIQLYIIHISILICNKCLQISSFNSCIQSLKPNIKERLRSRSCTAFSYSFSMARYLSSNSFSSWGFFGPKCWRIFPWEFPWEFRESPGVWWLLAPWSKVHLPPPYDWCHPSWAPVKFSKPQLLKFFCDIIGHFQQPENASNSYFRSPLCVQRCPLAI